MCFSFFLFVLTELEEVLRIIAGKKIASIVIVNRKQIIGCTWGMCECLKLNFWTLKQMPGAWNKYGLFWNIANTWTKVKWPFLSPPVNKKKLRIGPIMHCATAFRLILIMETRDLWAQKKAEDAEKKNSQKEQSLERSPRTEWGKDPKQRGDLESGEDHGDLGDGWRLIPGKSRDVWGREQAVAQTEIMWCPAWPSWAAVTARESESWWIWWWLGVGEHEITVQSKVSALLQPQTQPYIQIPCGQAC